MVDLHGWQVAAFVLGTIVGVRLVLAPYWLWRDQQIENDKLVQQLDRKRVREEALDTLPSVKVLFWVPRYFRHRFARAQGPRPVQGRGGVGVAPRNLTGATRRL
jgi:hypothetical protein